MVRYILLLISLAPLCFAAPKKNSNATHFSLDSLFSISSNWELTPEAFEKTFTNSKIRGYRWLTKDRTRAIMSRQLYSSRKLQLVLGPEQVPVEEVLVDFEDGLLRVVTVSVYNRAESPKISPKVFEERFNLLGEFINQTTSAHPQKRSAKPQQGLLTEGLFWRSRTSLALLENNVGAKAGGELEFLRIRLAHPQAKSPLAKAILNSRGGAAINISSLRHSVTKDEEGNVYVKGLPMIDQGKKGYCVVASAQRLFEYYGVGVDMHQLAQIADSDPDRGTSSLLMATELDAIDYRFKTRLDILAMRSSQGGLYDVKSSRGSYIFGKKVPQKKFYTSIRSSINEGIPLLWSLEVGLYPEEPKLLAQGGGGHMRTIIGYNDKKEHLIFSDSWGEGHEFKTMNMNDAFKATRGLFLLKPTTR